jgi:hypothetical protein
LSKLIAALASEAVKAIKRETTKPLTLLCFIENITTLLNVWPG